MSLKEKVRKSRVKDEGNFASAMYPGYEVSDIGIVRATVGRDVGHNLAWSVTNSGYLQVNLRVTENGKRKQKNILLARLVASTFIRPPRVIDPETGKTEDVGFINGENLDVRACNLCWETLREKKRRLSVLAARYFPKSSLSRRNVRAFSPDQVYVIRLQHFIRGVSLPRLMDVYRVTRETVEALIHDPALAPPLPTHLTDLRTSLYSREAHRAFA